MHLRGVLLSGAVLLAAAVVFATVVAPKLPPPYSTPSANNPPRVVPRPGERRLNVPPGFHIELWAEGFVRPRYMLLGPQNEVLLADAAARPEGKIYAFRGKERKVLIGNLYQPYGLAYLDGYLYVGEPDAVRRYKYDSANLTVGPGQEIVSLAGIDKHHWTRSLLIDPTARKIYVGIGSGSNDSTGEDPRRAAINRYNLDGSGHEIFAAGTRNPIGIHWYPGTHTLWAAVQERDTLGDELVPDYLTHIQEGGFYGWPYAYIGPNEDPINKGKAPGLVAKTIVPDVVLEPAHVAVLDFLFYTGKQFPPEYQGGALLALHGSWNRAQRAGYSVAFIPFRNGRPAGAMRDIVTGWMLGPNERDVWGRPVALLELPDGSVLISEDGNKTIWRLSYVGRR